MRKPRYIKQMIRAQEELIHYEDNELTILNQRVELVQDRRARLVERLDELNAELKAANGRTNNS